MDRSISYSEQQHFLFITLAHNRVRVLYEQVECQREREKKETDVNDQYPNSN
jgi:hypothetical protein